MTKHSARAAVCGLLLCGCGDTSEEQGAAVSAGATSPMTEAPGEAMGSTSGQAPTGPTDTNVASDPKPMDDVNPTGETDSSAPGGRPLPTTGGTLPGSADDPGPPPDDGEELSDEMDVVQDPIDGDEPTDAGPPEGEPAGETDDGAPQPGGETPPQTSATCDDGPLELPIDGCAPEFEETGDFYADCVERINQLRWECQCLPPLERWVEAESCADAQAEYDYDVGRAHAGINARICEPGGGSQNECPGYGPRFGIVDFCLQQMWDEGPGEDFQAHGHYINMSSTGVTKVACGRFETPEGDVWSVQNFSR